MVLTGTKANAEWVVENMPLPCSLQKEKSIVSRLEVTQCGAPTYYKAVSDASRSCVRTTSKVCNSLLTSYVVAT